MVLDYPTIEDEPAGLLLSGLHRRAVVIHKLLKQAGVDEEMCSFASLCSCVTKSKSAIKVTDYDYCSSFFLNQAISDINPGGIIAFGAAAGEYLTGERIMNIENVRGKFFEREGIPVTVTYQLGIISGRGCNSCGSANTHTHYVRTDIDRMVMHLKGKGIKFKR